MRGQHGQRGQHGYGHRRKRLLGGMLHHRNHGDSHRKVPHLITSTMTMFDANTDVRLADVQPQIGYEWIGCFEAPHEDKNSLLLSGSLRCRLCSKAIQKFLSGCPDVIVNRSIFHHGGAGQSGESEDDRTNQEGCCTRTK